MVIVMNPLRDLLEVNCPALIFSGNADNLIDIFFVSNERGVLSWCCTGTNPGGYITIEADPPTASAKNMEMLHIATEVYLWDWNGSGYRNTPPLSRFRWKSATNEPMYLDFHVFSESLSDRCSVEDEDPTWSHIPIYGVGMPWASEKYQHETERPRPEDPRWTQHPLQTRQIRTRSINNIAGKNYISARTKIIFWWRSSGFSSKNTKSSSDGGVDINVDEPSSGSMQTTYRPEWNGSWLRKVLRLLLIQRHNKPQHVRVLVWMLHWHRDLIVQILLVHWFLRRSKHSSQPCLFTRVETNRPAKASCRSRVANCPCASLWVLVVSKMKRSRVIPSSNCLCFPSLLCKGVIEVWMLQTREVFCALDQRKPELDIRAIWDALIYRQDRKTKCQAGVSQFLNPNAHTNLIDSFHRSFIFKVIGSNQMELTFFEGWWDFPIPFFSKSQWWFVRQARDIDCEGHKSPNKVSRG